MHHTRTLYAADTHPRQMTHPCIQVIRLSNKYDKHLWETYSTARELEDKNTNATGMHQYATSLFSLFSLHSSAKLINYPFPRGSGEWPKLTWSTSCASRAFHSTLPSMCDKRRTSWIFHSVYYVTGEPRTGAGLCAKWDLSHQLQPAVASI